MIEESRAIVLSRRAFKENEQIVSMFTERFGRVDFILYGAFSKKNGRQQAFLQPLSLVTVIADYRNGRDLQVVSKVRNEVPLSSLLTDPYKNTTALFLSEILTRALRTNEMDPPLFSFLFTSVNWLDAADQSQISNFHVAFLVRLSVFLGFTPNLGPLRADLPYFDLTQSEYVRYAGHNPNVLGEQEQLFLRNLLRINYRNMALFRFSRSERSQLLERIVRYYQTHIQGFGELRTLDVLHAVFDF